MSNGVREAIVLARRVERECATHAGAAGESVLIRKPNRKTAAAASGAI